MKQMKDIEANINIWDIIPLGYSGMMSGFIKLPDCGTCSVVFSNSEQGYEHVSISPKHKYRLPTWDDMCALKEVFWEEEEEVYQIHPKKSEYVNLKENCLHLWKPIGHELRELVEQQ